MTLHPSHPHTRPVTMTGFRVYGGNEFCVKGQALIEGSNASP